MKHANFPVSWRVRVAGTYCSSCVSLKKVEPHACAFPRTSTSNNGHVLHLLRNSTSWLPDLRAVSTPLDSAGRTDVGAWPTQDEEERYPPDQNPSPPRMRSGPSEGTFPAGPAAERFSPTLPSPTMSSCVSLPNLPSPATAGREATSHGSDENGVKGGGAKRRKPVPRGWASQGGVVTAGETCFTFCAAQYDAVQHCMATACQLY